MIASINEAIAMDDYIAGPLCWSSRDSLRQPVNCHLCPALCRSRTKIVPPTPCAKGGILAIGEAPGGDEDRIGEGFAGRAGKTLEAPSLLNAALHAPTMVVPMLSGAAPWRIESQPAGKSMSQPACAIQPKCSSAPELPFFKILNNNSETLMLTPVLYQQN